MLASTGGCLEMRPHSPIQPHDGSMDTIARPTPRHRSLRRHRAVPGSLPALCRGTLLAAIVAAWTACGAAWAFAPDMLPSSAIWTNFMQKIHEPKAVLIHEEDTDGDGVSDFKVYRHEDGAYIDVKLKPGPDGMIVDSVVLRENQRDKRNWVYGFDKNGDGQLEMLVRGWFAEGKWDQMLYDSDRDARPDRFLLDVDDNGVYDFMGVDIDGDGKLDSLYDLDNKTGEVLNETVGWVTFKELQRREGLPHLVYSFTPDLKTLNGEEPTIVSATWDYGDGTTRTTEELAPGEKVYAKAGKYEVSLEIQFKTRGSDRVYKAWSGISLPVEPAPVGPPPLTPETVIASVGTFYGASGFVTAEEQPKQGAVTELWPEAKIPTSAPAGRGLRASAVAAGALDLTACWWRSEAEANAFLDAMDPALEVSKLPAMAVRSTAGKPFELVSKVRARLIEKDGVRIAAWREGGFIITLSTTMTTEELQRWTRLLYDILHPAGEKTDKPDGK